MNLSKRFVVGDLKSLHGGEWLTLTLHSVTADINTAETGIMQIKDLWHYMDT